VSVKRLTHQSYIPLLDQLNREEGLIARKVLEGSHDSLAFQALLKNTYVNSWHVSDIESYLMWKVYAGEKGIAIQTTAEDIYRSLIPYKVHEGAQPEKLHNSRVQYINYFNDEMDKGNVKRFFYKHNGYSQENEYRFVVSLVTASEHTSVPKDGHIKLALKDLSFIKGVILSPTSTKDDLNNINRLLEDAGLNVDVKISEMGKHIRPLYI